MDILTAPEVVITFKNGYRWFGIFDEIDSIEVDDSGIFVVVFEYSGVVKSITVNYG